MNFETLAKQLTEKMGDVKEVKFITGFNDIDIIGVRIYFNDETGITLRQYSNKMERLEIHGIFPHGYFPSDWEKLGKMDITVSIDSSVDKIVNAIKKRLFPTYLPAIEEKLRQKKAHETYAENVKKHKDNLCKEFSFAKTMESNERKLRISKKSTERYIYGDIDVYEDSCDIDIRNIPIETVKRILKEIENL